MTVGSKAIRLDEVRIREKVAEAPQGSSSSRERLLLAGVLALTFATYASTFTFGWVYDDNTQILRNPDLRWGRAWYMATHHLWAFMPDTDARFYRPLLEFWLLVNRSIFGLNPHWLHVTTVLAHVLATALAYIVARMLLRSTGPSLLAAAIFGLHPLQAEVVSWISSVNDSLMAIFCFGSFIAARRARTLASIYLWALSGLLFFVAVLIKESSIFLPAVACIDIYIETHPASQSRRTLRAFGPAALTYLPVVLVWFIIRKSILGSAVHSFDFVSWTTALLTVPKLLALYLYRSILPIGLSPHYDCTLVSSLLSAQFFAPLLVLAILGGSASLLARRRRDLVVPYAWTVIPLLPALNVRWMNQGDFVHDRYTYMTIFGFALCLSAAVDYVSRRYAAAAVLRLIPFIMIPGLAFASAVQSQFWANDLYLFSRSVQIAPENEWAHFDYSTALIWRGRYAEAVQQASRSYQLRPGWRSASSAGFASFQMGDLSKSKGWYKLALEMNPNLGVAWFTLGQIRLREQSPADALEFFENALKIQPEEEAYHYALGVALERLSRPQEALAAYTTELRLHPAYSPAREALARLSGASMDSTGNAIPGTTSQ